MKKTILSLVCLIMMSTVTATAKSVVYVTTHHPAQRTEMVVVKKDKKENVKHLKKHHGKHADCKKCEKWRMKHAKKHNAKVHHKTHKHNVHR